MMPAIGSAGEGVFSVCLKQVVYIILYSAGSLGYIPLCVNHAFSGEVGEGLKKPQFFRVLRVATREWWARSRGGLCGVISIGIIKTVDSIESTPRRLTTYTL